MTHPLLGDPASMSALASTLRRTAVRLRADVEDLERAAADAAPGWTGPTAVATRRRVDVLAGASAEVATALEDSGSRLQLAATELAASIARLRTLEEEARDAGLEVRDGTVGRPWGITGLADRRAEEDGDRMRQSLQERVHQTVTTMSRHRTRLSAECEQARHALTAASDALRA